MNEQTNSPENTEETNSPDELSLLKERAKMMGIPISGNISAETLKTRIANKLAGVPEKPEEAPAEPRKERAAPRPKTKAEIEQETRDRLQRTEMRLVRCQIYNLNPSKRDLQGEIVTVANKYLGTVRKFIPFGEATDGGYHIPYIIFKHLKTRQFQQVKTKNVKGQIQVETRMVPEYNLVELPQLTKRELEELALKQAAAERVGIPE